VYGEIKGSIKSCINASPTNTTGKIGSDGRIRIKGFAYRGQLRIERMNGSMEVVPEGARDERKGIDAQPVESGRLNPPNLVLNQILTY
jgi:hypothetical protein